MTIKETRERLGKTQAEMAELLGISRNYLALIEVGKRPESPDLLVDCQQLKAGIVIGRVEGAGTCRRNEARTIATSNDSITK